MKTTSLLSLATFASTAFAGILDFQSQYHTQVSPEVQDMGPSETFKLKHPEAKSTKIRYGPFNIPNVNKKNFMYMLEGETGVLTTMKAAMKKPCNDCVLLGIRANLELPDGKLALINEGYWLHHMMMTVIGNKHVDLTCPMMPGERFYSSGNERTPTGFADNLPGTINTGVHVKSGDTWGMEIELMNLRKQDANTYLTLTYEYVPTAQPDWKKTRAVWLDVTGCFAASEAKPPKTERFSLSSTAWTSPVKGEMLGVGGHVHDGGKSVDIMINGKNVCTSEATYGGAPEFIQPAWSKEGKMAHISRMSFCERMGTLEKGDKIKITSNYDMGKNMPMKNAKGGLSTVMGIAIMYIVV